MKTMVKMKLNYRTIDKANKLEKALNAENKAQVVSMAISLLYAIETERLLYATETGRSRSVTFQYPDGTRKTLRIEG